MKEILDNLFIVYLDTKERIVKLNNSNDESYILLLFRLHECVRKIIRLFKNYEWDKKYNEVFTNPKTYMPDNDYVYNIWANN